MAGIVGKSGGDVETGGIFGLRRGVGRGELGGMGFLLATMAVLLLALSGLGLLALAWSPVREVPRAARLGLGFGVGGLWVTLYFFAAYLAGASFSRIGLFALTIAPAVYGGVVFGRGEWRQPRFELVVCLAVVFVGLALALSWSRPVYGYDAVSMWALKAKVMFFAQTWPPTVFDRWTTHHPEYPPLVPSVQAFVLFCVGGFDDVASRVVFAAFYAAGAATLWWWLRVMRASARGWWLVWWCALPVLMEQVKITYADLPLAVALLSFYGAGWAWARDPRRTDWLRLMALFGALAFWIKQDALIGVGSGYVALLVVALRGRFAEGADRITGSTGWEDRAWKVRPLLAAALGTAVLGGPWSVFIWWRGIPGDFAWPQALPLERVGLIVGQLANYAFAEGGYGFFWPVLVLTVIASGRRLKRSPDAWLAGAVALAIVGTVSVYACSTVDLAAQLKTSAERVLLTVYVPGLLLVASLWRATFSVLRSRWFEATLLLVVVVVLVVGFNVGLHRKSDEELLGVAISPYPLALSWVWLATGVVTLGRFLPRLRVPRLAMIWRAGQFAIVLATAGLVLVAVGVNARECGELRRRFGHKSLAAQHAQSLPPGLEAQIRTALAQFAPGTHVRVTPKRSLRYHRFYYETYPWLVVDDAAAVRMDIAPP